MRHWSFLGFGMSVALAYCLASGAAQDLLYDAVTTSAALAVAVGVRQNRPRQRRPWLLVCGGLALGALGDYVWDIYNWSNPPVPFPSGADIAYVSGYCLLALGLFGFSRNALGRDRQALLDYAILAASTVSLVFVVLVGPLLDSEAGLDVRVVSGAYPILDALMLAAVIPLLFRPSGATASRFLALGVVVIFGGDLAYGLELMHGSYVAGTGLDAAWLVGSSALGAAALHPSMAAVASGEGTKVWGERARLTAVAAALIAVMYTLATAAPARHAAYYVPVALAALVVGLVFWRVGLLVSQRRAAESGLERELRRLAAVDAVQRLVASPFEDLDDVLQRIARIASDLTGAHGVSVVLFDGHALTARVTEGVAGLAPGDTLPRASLCGAAMDADDVLLCADSRVDPRVSATHAATASARALAAAPLHYAGSPIGALVALHPEVGAFDLHDASTLQLMASLASVAVNRSEDFAARLAFDAVLDASDDAIVRWSTDGTVLSWNAGAERIYGYTADEMLGRSKLVLVPPESRNGPAFAVAELAQRDAPMTYEAERVCKDGRRITVSVIATPIRDARGRLLAISTIAHDITERRLLEEQLHQAQKLEAIGRLAGGVAHDFNNLLLAIGGYASFIANDPTSATRAVENAKQIAAASSRAADLTAQLLSYSRRQLLQPRIIDVNEVVDETVRMLERLVGDDVAVVRDYTEGLASVSADPSRLAQVLMNLGVNARDAMPQGGTITIETAPAPDPEWVVLRVRDTGTGMDAATRDRIFEPFFTTKEHGRGTGLGLATVYGTIKQSGGRIEVESEPGAGTTFSVYLRADAESPETRVPNSGTTVEGAGQRVLLVEDQTMVREVVAEMLRDAGYDVMLAADAEEALSLYASEGVDVLISDVVMPRMRGTELAERIHRRHPDVRIVLTSGYAEDGVARDEIKTPFAFVQKPFTVRELTSAIATARTA